MIIALCNDDGIRAPGIRALYDAAKQAGHTVYVVAPLSEQSAVGHAITVRTPLRVKTLSENGFAGFGVYGTPADCVKLGIANLLPEKPDIVLSGINAGANVGPDIIYSGTVAAAREGSSMGYSAMAVSYDSFEPADLLQHAAFAIKIMETIPWKQLPKRRVMNLNLPAGPIEQCKGLKVCPQTATAWRDWYHERTDPRGMRYWWIDGEIPPEKVEKGTDRACLSDGWATLTPLAFDFTDTALLTLLQNRM